MKKVHGNIGHSLSKMVEGGTALEISAQYFRKATVHRVLSGTPDNGILSCGFLTKDTASDTQRDLIFDHYGGLLVLNGIGEYQDTGHPSILLGPGCFVQRMPGVAHSTIIQPDSGWLEFFVCFGREFYESMANLGLFSREPVLFPGLSEQLVAQCGSLLEQFQKAPDSEIAGLFLSAQKFLLDIVESSRNVELGSMRGIMTQAAEILCTPDFPSPVETAGRLGMEYETFRKQFKRAYQCPPAAYQMRHRLNWAKQLLLDSQKNIQEIAELCKFSDAFAFSKAFRQRFGLSPSRFRIINSQ